MSPVLPCLLVGCGYVGSRLARREAGARPLVATARSRGNANERESDSLRTWRLDLDASEPVLPAAITAAACDAAVVYLVPPPEQGTTDPRLVRFLQGVGAATLPAVVVYVSTTGVYGDAGGELVDERTPPRPGNDRARRRVAAETHVAAWCASHGVRRVVLRVPGIYGPHRLPLARLARGEPAVQPDEAGPGNRIHVDDLVTAILTAVDEPTACGTYNVSDGDPSSPTEYLQETARATGLDPPPLASRAEVARRASPAMRSYLRESRRVDNRRMVEELGVRLRYPTMRSGVRASVAEMRLAEASTT